jgi:hypothetical protein
MGEGDSKRRMDLPYLQEKMIFAMRMAQIA